jgi:N-acetylmuramoyl-L-alanine amidase
MTLDDFIAKWNGKGIDVDDYYGFQCFDLAHRYAIDCVGIDIPGKPAAKDLWDCEIDGYDKIANSPTNVPSKGDVIIWGTAIGAYGHVAIFVSGNADSFTSLDQNWPVGSVCHLQPHNYTGVLGWFHPKKLVTEETVSVPKTTFQELVKKSTEYDKFVSAGYPTVQSVTDKIKGLQGTVQGLEDDNSELSNVNVNQAVQVINLQQIIDDLKKAIPVYGYSDTDILLDNPLGLGLRIIRYVKT